MRKLAKVSVDGILQVLYWITSAYVRWYEEWHVSTR